MSGVVSIHVFRSREPNRLIRSQQCIIVFQLIDSGSLPPSTYLLNAAVQQSESSLSLYVANMWRLYEWIQTRPTFVPVENRNKRMAPRCVATILSIGDLI